MNREAEHFLLGYAAGELLRAEGPLREKQLFPPDPYVYGIGTISAYARLFILNTMIQSKVVERVNRRGDALYMATNTAFLAAYAVPKEDPEWSDVENKLGVMKSRSLERKARLEVATRAIHRLILAEGWSVRNALFIAKRGDRYREKAAYDPVWQRAMLLELESLDLVETQTGRDGHVQLWKATDKAELQRILDGEGHPCIYEMLWPEEECTLQHGKSHPVEVPEADPGDVAQAPQSLAEVGVNEDAKAERLMVDEDPANASSEETPPTLGSEDVVSVKAEPSLGERFFLTEDEAAKAEAILHALHVLQARPEGTSRRELFQSVERESWQRDVLQRMQDARVITQSGQKHMTRYHPDIEKVRGLIADQEWQMKLFFRSALHRYTRRLEEGDDPGEVEQARDPTLPPVPAPDIDAILVGVHDVLKYVLSELRSMKHPAPVSRIRTKSRRR